MSKINIGQLACACAAFLATLIMPYFHLSFLGISFYKFIPMFCIGGLYPVFWIPVVGMFGLIFLTGKELKSVSVIAGIAMMAVHIAFLILKNQIILGGDIQVILQQAGNLIEQLTGDSNMNISEIRMVLQPLLKPHPCYFLILLLNVAYICTGVFLGNTSSSGTSNRSSRNAGLSGWNGRSSTGRRQRF